MQEEEGVCTELPRLGRPVYIQTFLPTSEHIRRNSVLEVNTMDDLLSNSLGVTAWENSCKFCDNFMEECPGHEGHLELPIPVYRIFFVRRLLSILNCICFYCQRLRLPKTDRKYAWIRSLPKKQRLKQLEKYSGAYKVCGQGQTLCEHTSKASLQISEPCFKQFVMFRKEDKDNTFIRAVIPLTKDDNDAYNSNPSKWRPITIGPKDIFDVISNLDDETKLMLGCDEWNDPSALMWDVLPIPSLNTRPSHTFAGIGTSKKRALNDWTKYLREIVQARNELKRIIALSTEKVTCCQYSVNGIEHRDFTQCFRYGYMGSVDKEKIKKRFKSESRNTNYGAIESAWRTLHKNIAAFHSHKHKKQIQKAAYGRPLTNIEGRYKFQKNGRFRGNVISRRTRLSGRGVLEGTILLAVDQAGIPKQEAMNLSVRINVNQHNMSDVQKWILNGPLEHPGANYITLKSGKEVNLMFYENRRTIDVTEVLFVERHLIDDDIVIVSRQPTLHRPSMMSFRVKVIDGYCIRLHYAVFTPLAADCDGDEVNFQVIQGLEAQVEARTISSVANSIMKDGKIWIQFILNPVIGAHLLTKPDTVLNTVELQFVMADMLELITEKPFRIDKPGYDESGEYDNGQRWSGLQVVSMILPPTLTIVSDDLVIRNGTVLKGHLNERLLNGQGGILHHMYRDFKDGQVTLKFIHRAYIVFQRYLDLFGHSVGYYDCAVDFEHEDAFRQQKLDPNSKLFAVMSRISKLPELVAKLNSYSDSLVGHTPDSLNEEKEKNVLAHISQLSSIGTEIAKEYHDAIPNAHQNGLIHMIRSGAKGSDLTLNQMCMIVGQIAVMYRRFPQPSSHFLAGQTTANAFGFIGQSYARGIGLSGIIMEAHAACESVVKKNKGTSGAGYTIRKLTSCMLGIVVDYKNRTIDTNNRIIWTVYGNDGYDPQCLVSVKVPLQDVADDTALLKDLRLNVREMFSRCLDILSPSDTRVPFDVPHLLDRCANRTEPDTILLDTPEYEKFSTLLWERLLKEKLVVDSNIAFKLVFFHWMSANELKKRRFGVVSLRWIAQEVVSLLVRATIQPGEAVGINATQNMGEPFAQLSLKTPHFSGKFTTVVAGTTRIANLIDGNFCNPQMTIVLKPSVRTQHQANVVGLSLVGSYLKHILAERPEFVMTDTSCNILCKIDRDKCIARLISIRGAVRNLMRMTDLEYSHFVVPFMDSPGELILEIRIPFEHEFWKIMRTPNTAIYNLCNLILISGLVNIENFVVEQVKISGEMRWVISTLGSNLRYILCMPQVDSQRTTSNDIKEMCDVFGTHSARKSLENEFMHVLSGKADSRHIKLVARCMTSDLTIQGLKIKQAGRSIPPLQRAAYERGPEQMVEYCSVSERDEGKTICGAVLMNKTLESGTGFSLTVKPQLDVEVPVQCRITRPTNIKQYVFSPKPDGVRYFLVLFHNRANTRIAVLVDRNNTLFELPADDFPDTLFEGTVLDGELVLVETKYVFLIFDCLMLCGNKASILRYDHRLELAREAVYRMCTKLDGYIRVPMGVDLPYSLPTLRPHVSRYALPAGKFPFLLSVKPIFDLSGMSDYRKYTLPFGFDGFVFTRLNEAAQPFRMQPTSILKWKPRMHEYSENTIDFIVTTSPARLSPWPPRMNGIPSEMYKFRNTEQTNVCLWCVLSTNVYFCFSGGVTHQPVVENQVYECRWNFQYNQWQVGRMRNKDANALETVVCTVKNIIEDISFEELCF